MSDLTAELTGLQTGLGSPARALLRRAYATAAEAHGGQPRRRGAPRIAHPLAVAFRLRTTFRVSDPEVLAAALLHDVLEDSADGSVLIANFSPRVQELVWRVTDPASHMSAAQRRRHYERDIWPDPDATAIRVSGRLSNLADSIHEDAGFRARYAARTKHEMLGPGSPLLAHPKYGPLLVRALERCIAPLRRGRAVSSL